MIRWIAAGFAVLFTLMVAMGYVPSFVTAMLGLVYWWMPRAGSTAVAR
jgi:hypothetical protein